jgi:methylmalonyl-CoA mutase N-terminal domain/subunit
VFTCIDNGWFVGEIADAAYAFQSKIAKGEWTMVGVNGYIEDDGVTPSTLSIGADVEREQLDRLAAVKQARDDNAVRRSLARIAKDASNTEVNLMPALIEASRHRVSVGEAMQALESVFGRYVERHVA